MRRHTIVAVTRRRSELSIRHCSLHVVGEDVSNTSEVAAIIERADVVVSALGQPQTFKSVDVPAA